METDLDFLLYGGLTLARFACAVSADFEAFSTLDPADERRSGYVRERPGLFPRPELAERRSDVGWCGPVKVDLTEVGPPREPVADLIFDRPRSAKGEITGAVESVARGYPIRCRLEGGAPVVVVTRRGWQGILQPGDQVSTSGVLYSSPSGDEFVVDEFGRDPIIAGNDFRVSNDERKSACQLTNPRRALSAPASGHRNTGPATPWCAWTRITPSCAQTSGNTPGSWRRVDSGTAIPSRFRGTRCRGVRGGPGDEINPRAAWPARSLQPSPE
jgi:hypothetical protein